MEHTTPLNFIEQIIEKDISNNTYPNIRTRFPPEPNGYLHIGHAKSICLNFGLAKKYDGLCNLRFDDTNPTKEDQEYIDSIKANVKWLGFNWDGDVRYSSSYFDALYNYAIELIEKGLAYVDDLSQEEIREYRGTLTKPGKNSPHRDRSIQENLDLFKQMKDGQFKDGEKCLRAKIDMSSNFMVMRDPVIYRIKHAYHHQTKDAWCIYPMYDFTHCISDALENISHSICTLEFQDNRRLYDWVLDNISIPKPVPHQHEFARLQLEYTLTSKRKLLNLVESNIVDGWDDPRMPTISALQRRGITPESIRMFSKRIGVTKQDSLIEWNAFSSCIREDLNVKAQRTMAVIDPVKLVITNLDHEEILKAPKHPDNEEYGEYDITFNNEIYIDRADFKEEANKKYKRLVLGKVVRLRYAYTIKAESCEKDIDGNITTIYCTYDKDTLGKNPVEEKVRGVIHWISNKDTVNTQFNIYDHLFLDTNPGACDDINSILNPNSIVIKNGFTNKSLLNEKPDTHYQFEREGYFFLDKNKTSDNSPIYNLTIALKDTNKF